jgi:hypothetical protein
MTRAEFDQQRAVLKAFEDKSGMVLASVSVGLGFAQLGFLAWAEAHMARGPRLAIAGSVCIAYVALVLVLLVWRERGFKRVSPRCPGCARPLREFSLRVAAATGHCDACGAQVVE